ncbi:hypothetical protein PR048_024955 [Dryococelus australis]|uniref:Dirigent protein n=1 Tax=Dryococelus australis TaxID=614101 RepID=A0ABQ9GQ12_9NEOP|nr:hypothetical protein PR048_024955 [Dryococelus australis]
MKRRGKQQIPEKTRRPKASSGTIPTCENPVTRPGIEPGSPWWETSCRDHERERSGCYNDRLSGVIAKFDHPRDHDINNSELSTIRVYFHNHDDETRGEMPIENVYVGGSGGLVTRATRVRSPAGLLLDFRMWESCWTMPLAGGFSLGASASPTLAFQRLTILGSHFMLFPSMTGTGGSQLESSSLGGCRLALGHFTH